jgi:hypothetical protein
MSLYTLLADDFQPPALSSSSDFKVHQASVTAAAAEADLDLPRGVYYVTFAALSADVYVAFKPIVTSGAAVTTTTGWKIPAGEERSFVIHYNVYRAVEHIGSGAGTLKWYVSSSVRERPYGR